MTNTMTIGDFSRATRLSAKALRLYHQAGLLEPAWVDPVNGYRVYTVDQISQAQVVRHFRSLQMPVEQIREMLAAPDIPARNLLIAAHLAQMEAQLEQTRSAVAALRGLLAPGDEPVPVVLRSVPATLALVIRDTIELADLGAWYTRANAELEHLATAGLARSVGPRGGIWDTDLFLDERGTAVVFLPIASASDLSGSATRARVELLPEVDLAVATHRGPDATISAVYGALGQYVAVHELGIDGPIREFYLREPATDGGDAVTEIGWPVRRGGAWEIGARE